MIKKEYGIKKLNKDTKGMNSSRGNKLKGKRSNLDSVLDYFYNDSKRGR